MLPVTASQEAQAAILALVEESKKEGRTLMGVLEVLACTVFPFYAQPNWYESSEWSGFFRSNPMSSQAIAEQLRFALGCDVVGPFEDETPAHLAAVFIKARGAACNDVLRAAVLWAHEKVEAGLLRWHRANNASNKVNALCTLALLLDE